MALFFAGALVLTIGLLVGFLGGLVAAHIGEDDE